MRARNSAVLARSLSSESFCISGSRALIAATRGCNRLTSRSFFVPKTLPNKVLIKRENPSGDIRPQVSLKPSTLDASGRANDGQDQQPDESPNSSRSPEFLVFPSRL